MIIHEFENMTITKSAGGDYYIEIECDGVSENEILILSPNGSDEHKRMEAAICDPDKIEDDFIGDDLLSFLMEKDGPAESWNCPECGDSLFAIEFGGNWYQDDTSDGKGWQPAQLNLRPDYSGIECGCSKGA